MPRAANTKAPDIKDLNLSPAELAMAKDFVQELGIGTKDKYYYYAILWCKNNIKANGDFLSPNNRKRFDAETEKASKSGGRPGALHLKILYEITELESNKPDTNRPSQNTSATANTLKLNRRTISRSGSRSRVDPPKVTVTLDKTEVQKGDSYTVTWKSENANHVSRSAGFPQPIASNELSGSVTLVADRIGSKSFEVVVRNDKGTSARARVTINIVAAQVTPSAPSSPTQRQTTRRTRQPRSIRTPRTQGTGGLDNDTLVEINKSLGNILEILKKQNAFVIKIGKISRKEAENQRRKKREGILEQAKKINSKVLEKVFTPIKSIFEKIWQFIFYTFLGRAFSDFIKWFNDPKNSDKVKSLGRFLKDFWPLIAGAIAFFFVPFKGFILKTLAKLTFWSAKFLLLKNPLALAGATALGLAFAAGKVTGQIDDAKNQAAYKARVKSGKALEIRGADTPIDTSPSIGELGITTPYRQEWRSYAGGGLVDNRTGVRISGAGEDTQLTALKPGEVVMNTQAVKAVGANNLLALNSLFGGPNANKPRNLGSKLIGMSGGGMVGAKNPSISEADYSALLAISAAEDFANPQGRADVAQAIYNRLYAAKNYGENFLPTDGKNTIKNLITGNKQFEPTFKNREDWLNIKDRNTAAIALSRYKKIPVEHALRVITETDQYLKNPEFQKNARKHVQGRTFFLGTKYHDNMKPGDVVRSKKHNFFSHWTTEGKPYHKERGSIPAPVPVNVLPKKKPKPSVAKMLLGAPRPSAAATRSKAPQRAWWDPRKWVGKRRGGMVVSADLPTFGGRSDDRHPILLHNETSVTPFLAQAGEQVYVIPKTVVQRGGVNIIDNIVGQLDRTSEPARLQASPKQETLIPPMTMGPSMSQVMTLPAITSGTPSVGKSSGNTVPPMTTISPMAGSTRRWLVQEMYNIL